MVVYRICLLMVFVLTSGTAYAGSDTPALCEAGECHRTDKVGAKNACQCYCSHKCGPREWKDEDPGFYVQNDPHGKGCYCKPWDYQNFHTSDDGKSCAIVEKEREQEEQQSPKKKQKTNSRKAKKVSAL